MRAAGQDRAARARDALTMPEGSSSSRGSASSDTVRNVTKLVYVLVRGGTKVGSSVLRRRFPGVSLEASAGEARDIARPLARMVARRVDWTGDTSDAMDGLFLLFALAGYVAERTGIDLENLRGDPGWDSELYNQIGQEVRATRRRRRRPAGGTETPGTEAQAQASEPAPVAPTAPQSAPAGAEPAGAPVLLAERLTAATFPTARAEQ